MIGEINFKNVIKFTLPSIAATLFMSFYTMVDGAFVSNLINQTALSAINITLPVILLVIAVGMMIATGGNAIYAKLLGENNRKKANSMFTQFTVIAVVLGVLISAGVLIFIKPILTLLGATGDVWQYSYDYLTSYMFLAPLIILQSIVQISLITANRPNLSLISMLAGGFTNIVLDYIFIGIFEMGIAGAAIATGLGGGIGALIGIIFFATKRDSRILAFSRFNFDIKASISMAANGSSEMVTNLSSAVVTLLFNQATQQLAGSDGVAAVTVVLYAGMFASSVFMGYAMGIAPVISFNYGEQNTDKLKALHRFNIKFIVVISFIMLGCTLLANETITNFFLEKGTKAYDLSIEGIAVYSLSFIFSGFNIYASSMFTAFSNGKISAILSFLRTFLLISVSILILPRFLGIFGVWLSVPVAEIVSIIISIFFINRYSEVYMYGNSNKIIKKSL